MSISSDDVEYLSHLARIQLTPAELERLGHELNQILDYVEKLKKANVENVAPTAHVLKLSNVFREDQVVPSLSTDVALANAPSKEGPFFKVPKIIEST